MNVIITQIYVRMDDVLITMVATAASVSRATFSMKLEETAKVSSSKCRRVFNFFFHK